MPARQIADEKRYVNIFMMIINYIGNLRVEYSNKYNSD